MRSRIRGEMLHNTRAFGFRWVPFPLFGGRAFVAPIRSRVRTGLGGVGVVGLIGVAVCALLIGCGPKAPAQEPEPTAEPIEPKPQLQTYGEFGVLDEAQVRATFERVWKGPMTACQRSGGDNISGVTLVRMRVNHSGQLKWVYFKETNLADQKVQACMLDALRAETWPIPEGGEDGLAEQELPFGDYASRAPIEWDPDKVQPAVQKNANALRACRKGATGDFLASAIVNTNGFVASVGVQQPDETADDAASCMVQVLGGIKFPKPGSWPAKVSFYIP